MLEIERSAKYKRHRAETTLLYQLVERYYREFYEYLLYGCLEHSFMRSLQT